MEDDAPRLVELASAARVLGPLLVAIDAGALEMPDELVERVVARHRSSMLWAMHLEHRLLDVHDWFAAAGGIEFLVVKGPAVAHLDDHDPSLRAFNDLDLLVRADQIDDALAALELHGARRRLPARRAGFDRRFVKSVGVVCEDEVELDVHRTFTAGPHGFRIPLDRLFDDVEHFEIGSVELAAPNRVNRALHAAYHAIVSSPRPPLRTIRDLAGYLTSPDLPPSVLAAEARAWRGETVLVEAVRAAFATLEFEAPAWTSWLDRVEPDPEELAIIDRGHGPSGWPVQWRTLRELGWRDRAAFTWAVAAPSAETLAQRDLTAAGRVWFGARRAVRRWRPR